MPNVHVPLVPVRLASRKLLLSLLALVVCVCVFVFE